MVEAEGGGQPAEDLRIRQAFARRVDGRLVPGQVEVAVGPVQIGVLRLHRRREHDVREVGRVGEAMLENDGEQIIAGQALADAQLVRVRGRRVRVEDHQRCDGRLVELGERLAEP